MRSLLCGVLSVVLLVNSVVPSFADVAGTGRALAAARRLPALLQTTAATISHIAADGDLSSQIARQAANVQRMLPAIQQQWLKQSKLPQFVTDGTYKLAAQNILSLEIPEKLPLLRNEWVLLNFMREVSAEEFTQARELLRADLFKNQAAFKKLPADKSLEEILKMDTPEVKACQQAFSDAASLALTGSKEDSGVLIDFYNSVAGSAFEPEVTRLVGRSLLRFEDYATFLDWSGPLEKQGDFWVEIAAYLRSNRLPIMLHPSVEPGLAETEGMIDWLESGNLANGLNADNSFYATQQWISLGKRRMVAAEEPVSQTHQTPVSPDLTQMNLLPGAQAFTAPVLPQVTGVSNTPGVSPTGAAQNPGLYSNDVYPVYENVDLGNVDSDDAYSLVNPLEVEIAEGGFKLTFEDKNGTENILANVNLIIDSSLDTEGYNRVALGPDGIFELRNGNKPAGKMSHFIVTLSYDQGELYTLAQRVSELPLYRPMRIKLERNRNERYKPIFLDVVDFYTGKSFNIQAMVDSKILPKGASEKGKILLDMDGSVYYQEEGSSAVLLKGFYVRLPKGESPTWMAALQREATSPDAVSFNLHIIPTEDKAGVMTNITSPLRVGFAKIAGPIFKSLGFPEWLVTLIPLFANNFLPALLGPLMPYLRRQGDANMYRLGVALVAAAFCAAVGIGFNGFTGLATGGEISPWITYGLPGVLIAAGFGGVLMNTPQNNLVRQNAGVLLTEQASKGWTYDPTITPNLARLWKRLVEVFTTKDTEETDSVRRQKLSLAKNAGSVIFWSLPFLFNVAARSLGSSLEADFSLGFAIFAPFALYGLYKILKLPLKDSTPRNTAVLHNMVVDLEHNLIPQLREEIGKEDWDFEDFAKELNKVLTPYARGLAYKFQEDASSKMLEEETNSLNRLKTALVDAGVEENVAQQALTELQTALDKFGHRDINLRQVLRMPGVLPTLCALIGLTVHELGGSGEFAFQVNDLIKQYLGIEGEMTASVEGLALSAAVIYGSTWASRYAGNWLARRITEGSMYTFSSAMSVVGTGMMIGAGDNLATLLTGGVMAMFGMGNFFAQMYGYIMKQAPEYRQELAVLIANTMPIAALLSAGVHTISDLGATYLGIDNLGMMTAMGSLLSSFVLAPGIFHNSTITGSARYYGRRAWNAIRGWFGSSSDDAGNATGGAVDAAETAAPVGAN